MSIFTSILTAGTNSHQTTSEEANRFRTNFVTPGIVGAFTATTGAYAVTAQGTPDKTLLVALGDAVVNVTPATQANQNLSVRSTANVTITIADNTSGATRYDWIYLSIDPTLANNPPTDGSGVSSIVVNRSTSSSVDTVGAPAYSEKLAMVTVVNGFTSLAAGTISDLRRAAGAAVAPGSIGTTALANLAVTAAKMGLAATTGTNSGTAGGSTNYLNLGTFKIAWGTTAVYSQAPGAETSKAINFPITFSATPFVIANMTNLSATPRQVGWVDPTSATVCTGNMYNFDGSITGTGYLSWIAIGT